MVEEEGEGFLARWSRRKREPGIADDAVEPSTGTPPELAIPEEPDEEMEANRVAAEAIDIDALGKGDDFTVFLRRGVPEALRKQALRKLWRTNPVLANLDGLNDYEEDFRNPAHNVYKSAWQIGRGFLSVEEQTAQQTTGRISRQEEPAVLEADSGIPADPAADETAEAADTEIEREIGDGEDDPEAVAAGDMPGTEELAGEDAEPRRRVSIRRRLEG